MQQAERDASSRAGIKTPNLVTWPAQLGEYRDRGIAIYRDRARLKTMLPLRPSGLGKLAHSILGLGIGVG